jgi:hypothetical protein
MLSAEDATHSVSAMTMGPSLVVAGSPADDFIIGFEHPKARSGRAAQ